jgi:hypothetical protein
VRRPPPHAGRLVASALRGLRLELTRLARFDVVAAATKLSENPGLLDLALERFERPLETICFSEVNFWHIYSYNY